jgi:hypothetical protein
MTEKRQTSQGYIIRILQHFKTKLRNITNFVMLFHFVQTCLDQNFTQKGKGLLYICEQLQNIIQKLKQFFIDNFALIGEKCPSKDVATW